MRHPRLSMLSWSLTAALTLLLIGAMLVHAAPTQKDVVPEVCTNGRILFSPNPGTTENVLRGVVTLSYKNVWAVGQYHNDQANVEQTLVEHWDGKSWSVIASPNVGQFDNFLYGVAAVSPTDIWAVGYYYTSSRGTGSQTLTEHWDGTRWSIVASSNPGSKYNDLYAIAAVSSNDFWAVGDEISVSPLQDNTLIEHWDGANWSVVSSPNPGAADNILQGVAVVSANDIWAAGNYSVSNGHNQTLAEHWNGSSWRAVSSPNVGRFANFLDGVAAVSSNDVWAVGYNAAPPGDLDFTLIEHWNGTSWSVVSSPNPNPIEDYLESVVAFSSSNVWAVGYDDNNGGSLIEQWDGTNWHVILAKNQRYAANVPIAVSADTPADIWIVGFSLKHHQHNFIFQTLIQHYCP